MIFQERSYVRSRVSVSFLCISLKYQAVQSQRNQMKAVKTHAFD